MTEKKKDPKKVKPQMKDDDNPQPKPPPLK